MATCTERLATGRCMFEAKAGSEKCSLHDTCTLCGGQHGDKRRYRCRCGAVICAAMARDGIYRDGKAHRSRGAWCGPAVLEGADAVDR